MAQSQSQLREEFLGRKAGLSFPNYSCLGELGSLLAPEQEEEALPNAHFKYKCSLKPLVHRLIQLFNILLEVG